MNSEFGESVYEQALKDDDLLPAFTEYYVGAGYDPNEAINSGGVEVKTDKQGGRYYKIGPQINGESLEILRTILKHPSNESFTAEELKFTLPEYLVFSNGMSSFTIAQDSKVILTPRMGVIVKDADIQEESLIRRNFAPGKNPLMCQLPGITHYRYQVDSMIKDHPVFEWEGVKYGAHLMAGVYLKTLSPTAIREDLEMQRRIGMLKDSSVRDWVNPYFGINLFVLPEVNQ